jgi:hypothetical protein
VAARGALAAWRAARRIGVLMNLAVDDAEGQARIAAFLQGLQQLGGTDSGNVRIDYRWAAGPPQGMWRHGSSETVSECRGVAHRSRAINLPG